MKTWFITGASAGLGRALTESLLSKGDRVAAILRKPEVLDDLAARSEGRLWRARLDVTDTTELRRVVAKAFAELGRIDVVVSNAGYATFGAAEELDDAQIERLLATNLVAPIHLIRAVLPFLRAQGGGRVLQVSSEGGQIAYPAFSAYHASKWGIEGFVESVAAEVAPFGIEFTLVEPGPTKTSFGEALDRPTPLDIYENTPVGEIRRALASGAFELKGDAVRTIEAMIDSVARTPAPRRLALGSTAYESIRAALKRRLDLLEAQKDIALSADG